MLTLFVNERADAKSERIDGKYILRNIRRDSMGRMVANCGNMEVVYRYIEGCWFWDDGIGNPVGDVEIR